MTRDSKLLPILQVCALVLAAVVAMMANPADYGLSPIAVKWLALLSTVVGTVSGFLSTSPLKGENDANKSNSSARLPLVLLVAALGAGGLGLMGCGGKAPAQQPGAAPTTVAEHVEKATTVIQSADAKVRAMAEHALGILDAAGDVLDEVITSEKKVEVLMSPKMRADTRAALNAVNDRIELAAVGIKAGVRTEAELKASLDPVVASAQQLASIVGTLPAPSQSRQGFGALVQMLLKIAQSSLAVFGGEPIPEGAQ